MAAVNIKIASCKILIVEDDLAIQPFWQLLVKRCFDSYQLDWAISSEEARKMLQRAVTENHPYQLIVTDLFLSGAETGLDLLASQKGTAAKMILVSSVGEKNLRENFVDIMNDKVFISKPLNLPKCERAIDKLFA